MFLFFKQTVSSYSLCGTPNEFVTSTTPLSTVPKYKIKINKVKITNKCK